MFHKPSCGAVALVCAVVTLILPLLPFVPLQAESYNELDYGQYYGYASDPSIVGAAALAAHDPYFGRMGVEAIKAPHGHFQHIAPADPGDDFPYAEFKEYAAVELAAGGAGVGTK
jgi:hypothetical protein